MEDDRRERRSVEQRRGELVDAAISLVAAEGLSNATTRRITERAGVALGAFHYAFASKAELIAAVMDRIASQLESAFDTVGRDASSLAEAIDGVLEAHASFVSADPQLQLARQELTVRALRDPALQSLVSEQRGRVQAALERSLRAGRAGTTDGTTNGDQLSDLAGYLAATLDGLVLHRLVDPEGAARRESLHADAVSSLTTGRHDRGRSLRSP